MTSVKLKGMDPLFPNCHHSIQQLHGEWLSHLQVFVRFQKSLLKQNTDLKSHLKKCMFINQQSQTFQTANFTEFLKAKISNSKFYII